MQAKRRVKRDNRARHRTDLRWNPSTTFRAVNQNAQKPYQYGLLESGANEIEKTAIYAETCGRHIGLSCEKNNTDVVVLQQVCGLRRAV